VQVELTRSSRAEVQASDHSRGRAGFVINLPSANQAGAGAVSKRKRGFEKAARHAAVLRGEIQEPERVLLRESDLTPQNK